MKKNKLFLLFLPFLFFTSITFGATEDTQIINEINKNNTSINDPKFELKTFKSCDDMKSVMSNFLKEYYKNNPIRRYDYDDQLLGGMEKAVTSDALVGETTSTESSNELGGGSETPDYSQTNIQVAGVDEADIVKTDGKYIYFFSESYNNASQKNEKYVYIAKAYPSSELEVVKKIQIPETFYNGEIFIDAGRLAIVATGYVQYDYSYYWINRNTKTYVIVYNTTDIQNLKLEKIYSVDGDYTKSRKIGDYLYIISNNYINFPYYSYDSKGIVPEFDLSKSLPKDIDITKTSDINDQNLVVKGKKFPYNVKTGTAIACNEIEYILPDADTMKQYSFNPSYNIISIINIKDTSKEVKNKVVFGNTGEIYMSLDNLYLTSHIYSPSKYSCPAGARCIMPWFPAGENTLIHKLNVDENKLKYQNTTMVPGSPLNQYSMDEYESNFRIITTQWSPQRQTNLFILDKDLKKLSSLEGIAKGENFQSSRYIGDKLFLVTFEQIDPLFVIDLANVTHPKIIGELKIPGYSTYLHPYDENHLIGLGYDTSINQWGGTTNGGLKVDLYEINYDKKAESSSLDCTSYSFDACPNSCVKNECASACPPGAEICTLQCVRKCENPSSSASGYIDVKQLQSLVLGDSGSYSEALNNPRMFIWNASKKLLLLPAQLYYNYPNETYKRKDFFQGLIAINIDKIGIKEKKRISHIDTTGLEQKRIEECKKYTVPKESETTCKELLDGTIYCPPKETYYVPEYCYKESTIGSYLASQSWNFSQYFIKRALYIGDTMYSISDKKIQTTDINNFTDKESLELK
ncbi:hypothetical protein HGA92_00620 [Candidatus Gracilibacteria bacterium]|nr:hypothetical protein [Candidatus Gracilibacteria bacterium]NUJ98888.1 hypothetical protein [Candidatus Gracilibacteria bacterium]